MNINQFRSDFLAMKGAKGVRQAKIAHDFDIDQATLSRFIAGKQGLDFSNVVKLWPLVYGYDFPTPRAQEPPHA